MLTILCAALLGQLTPLPLADGGPLGLDDLGVTSDGRFIIPEADLGVVLLWSAADPLANATRVAFGGKVGSAAVNKGVVAAGDRKAKALALTDLQDLPTAKLVTQPLASGPDYVRLFRDEAWVTEPGKEQIEVFSVSRKPLALKAVATLAVPGGPEALELDEAKGVAYTFSEDQGHLIGFDVVKHARATDWPLACPGKPKGLALSGGGLAFIGCSDGAALTISLKDGTELSRLATGAGVDIIAFDRKTRRLYVPGAKAATMTIASVAPSGALTKLREVPTAPRAHCVAVSDGVALVCDPPNGRLLRLDDC